MRSLSNIRLMEAIEKYNIRAKKSLGQNFLVDKNALSDIVQSIDLNSKNIVEVGPGYGALTDYIVLGNPGSLVLLELDKEMVEILNERIHDKELKLPHGNIDIMNINVLDYERIDQLPYSVIANIPYYITSPILHHFLYRVSHLPDEMVIMMQKDVADKILASQKNKKPKSSVLSLFLSKKTSVEKIRDVGKISFFPSPKVDSSVLKFTSHNLFEDVEDGFFLEVIKKGFSEPRKLVVKNLVKSGFNKQKIEEIFKELSLSLMCRPENLDIKNWCDLIREIE